MAQVKPEVAPAPVPEPTAPPKPQPPPPTRTPEGPAVSTAAQPVVTGVVSQASLPPDGGKKAAVSMAVADAQVAALLHIKAPEPYNAKGKVDPFEPLLRDETTSNVVQLKSKKRSPSTPLENIDIGQLKLVAIIAAASGKLAMVQESSGKGYLIRPGTFIGTNSGKVISIEADKVLFEEEYEDIHGKTITKKKEMTLPKPPGEL
jgi:type IV pilus assembly protein PilP